MHEGLLSDFQHFLEIYRETWNRGDVEGLLSFHHAGLQVRWGYPDGQTADWGYQEACQGWREAFTSYEGQNPKWHFEDVTVAPVGANEAFVAYWVTFEMDGTPTAYRNFFVETFRRDERGWKKIREYVESNLPKESVPV